MTDSGPRDRSATERINELLVEGFVTDPVGTAMDMIEKGLIMLGEQGHRDFWDNYVPSRTEVEPGTKGSPEFVALYRESVEDGPDEPPEHEAG